MSDPDAIRPFIEGKKVLLRKRADIDRAIRDVDHII